MLEICERLADDRGLEGVPGVVYKDGDKVVMNPARPLIENLDELPLPARHLLDMDWYLTPPGLVRGAFLWGTLGILASRGCPYSCIFCGSNNKFGRKVRRRSVENVVGEIEQLIQRYSMDGYFFYDGTFTLDIKYVMSFCEALKGRKINLKWGCQVRVNTVSEEMIKAMKETGCIQVDIGMESGSERILKSLKKGTTPEMIQWAFDMIH
jgi:radical SAM superfamily enzyme YgiQ (UPF0313 family)